MCNLIDRFYNNFIFTKPSVSFAQQKTLNVFFKKSLDRVHTVINISNYDHFSIESVLDNNEHIVVLNGFKNGIVEKINLGRFATKSEADKACTALKAKFFSIEKTNFKFFVKLFFYGAVFLILFLLISSFFRVSVRQSPMAFTPGYQLGENNPNFNADRAAKYNEAVRELNALLAKNGQSPQGQPSDSQLGHPALGNPQPNSAPQHQAVQDPQVNQQNTVEVHQDPAVKDFLNGLNK
jgi:hypothetical protein